jgi:hypothetical protein
VKTNPAGAGLIRGGIGMKIVLRGVLMGFLIVTIGLPCVAAGEIRKAPAVDPGEERAETSRVRPDIGSIGGLQSIGSVLSGIHVPAATVDEFTTLYNRHKTEIRTIVDQHTDLVWQTLDVVVDALPALQSFDKAGGRLYLDRRVYAKANRLFDEYVRLAGSGLAKDLRKAKRSIDNRTEDWGSNQVMIDLSE